MRQKRKHFILPEPYQSRLEEEALAAGLPESRFVAIHLMNAMDAGLPAIRNRALAKSELVQ